MERQHTDALAHAVRLALSLEVEHRLVTLIQCPRDCMVMRLHDLLDRQNIFLI